MGDVVNLRRARKAKARTTAEATARTNRALHGRTKAEKATDTQTRTMLDRTLDGAKRED